MMPEALISIADPDLARQEHCLGLLDGLRLAGQPAEVNGGVVRLIRLLHAAAAARDAAAPRLWCSLSVRQLAARLHCSRSTCQRWLRVACERGLVLAGPDPDHAQGLRHRPQWDALAGLLPQTQPPLFVPAVEKTVPPTVPLDGTVSENRTCGGYGFPKNRPTNRPADGTVSDFSTDFSVGGLGGLRPEGGGAPQPPTAWDGLDQPEPRQLLLQFGGELSRVASATQRLEVRVESLAQGQQETNSLLRLLLSRERDAAQAPPPLPLRRPKPRTAAPPADASPRVRALCGELPPELPEAEAQRRRAELRETVRAARTIIRQPLLEQS